MDWSILFNGWSSVGRTLVLGVSAYVSLVLLLRISGKRTLSKMNAFDLVVTVALGSTLATILLSKDVSLMQGVAGLGVLIALQYAVAWSSVRSATVRQLARSEPRLLAHRGEMLRAAMKEERISEDELLSAVRSNGFSAVNKVDAVILETDGTFSVIGSASAEHEAALEAVRGYRSD